MAARVAARLGKGLGVPAEAVSGFRDAADQGMALRALAAAEGLTGISARSMKARSAADLVASLRSGDQAAFQKIFRRYQAQLQVYLVRQGVPPSVADDILQNAFLSVWERRASLDPNKSLKAYLYRACHNRALNYFRDNTKFVTGDDPPERPTAPDQEANLEYSELQAELDKAVAELPEKRRVVFEMCFINGLSYREAAEALDISVKTVENYREHIKAKLRLQTSSELVRYAVRWEIEGG